MLLVFVIFTLFVRTFIVAHVNVPTPSMVPAVLVGDHILVNRFVFAPHLDTSLHRLLPYRDPALGDVVTFPQPDRPRRDLIKRIIALPGDTIAINGKTLTRNGAPADEPWAVFTDPQIWPDDPSTPPSRRARDHLAPMEIPPDSVFCLGDNRDESQDSRVFGAIPKSAVRGRAVVIYWSFDAETEDGREIGGVRHLLNVWLNFFSRTRWERQFMLVR